MAINKNRLGGALLYIAGAILLIIAMDYGLGGASAWLYHRSKYGLFHRQQYILNESKDDVIILGSSRAAHHYVPSIISDSLGMSCYNAGSEGMCIYYHYAMLAAMIERGARPKLVIYDVMDLDLMEYPGPTFTLDAALDRLAPHYGVFDCVDSLFFVKGWKERIKLLSLSYRYNSKLVQSIKCNFLPLPEDNGYERIMGVLPEDVIFESVYYNNSKLDHLKLCYLYKLVELTKENNIKLFFVLSPYYKNNPSLALDTAKEIASDNNLVLLDCYNEPSMLKREYFRDVMHLNDEGAHIWTSYIAHLIKVRLQLSL